MNFLKMEGTGNDFILTHEIESESIKDILKTIPSICNRKTGVGADGVIFILPSSLADFKMRIFNSDGSEAQMCGNGARCFSLYLKLLNLTKLDKISIETEASVVITKFINENMIRVDMGKPVLEGSKVPVSFCGHPVKRRQISVGNKIFNFTAISMGNPHAVIYADELSDELVLDYGPQIECHPCFPQKTNVEFIKVLSEKEIAMRVWERGCGETQSCGTGACASVVSGIINELHGKDILVHLPGGELQVQWNGSESDSVFLTGPAKKVFEGKISIPVDLNS
ncbi:MAG: diaminopimelate epimerase [Fibrobacter sp.]|nr:diaminopimelate epimerase [Fibrobacter sp.]